MRINKEAIPVKFAVPGVVARQLPDFGDATDCGTIGDEYFSLGAGTDIAPLLHGLVDDLCQAPHWGYVISGDLVVRYTDGSEEPAPTATSSTGRPVTPSGSTMTPR